MIIDALQRRWAGLANASWWPVVPLFLIQLVSGMWLLPQMSFFPIYLEEQLKYAPVAIASLVAASQLAGMVAGLVGGALSDIIGSKSVLLLGMVGGALAALAFRTHLPAVVTILWMVGGMANAFHTLGGSSYLTRMAGASSLGILSAFYALSLTTGGAVGSPAIGIILDRQGFGAYSFIVLALVAVTLTLATFGLPRLQPQESHTRGAGSAFWVGAIELIRRPVVLMLIGLRFLPTIFYGMAGVLIPLMINHLAGNKTTVAIYASISLVAASGAQLLAGRAADRFGRRWPTLIGYGAMIVGPIGLALFSNNLWGVCAFGVLSIAAAWAVATLMFCLISDGVPPVEHGRVFGLLHATWSISMVCGSMLGGVLMRVAPGLPFLVAGLLNVGAVVLALAFFAHVKRRA